MSSRDIVLTDTKNISYWGAGLGLAAAIISGYSLNTGQSVGLGLLFLVIAVWCFLTAFLHSKNGKSKVLVFKETGVEVMNEHFIKYSDVEKLWVGDPYPMLSIGTLHFQFHLKPSVEIKQTGRSWKPLFWLSHAGANISLIRKKKSLVYMGPGVKILEGKKMTIDEIVDELYERIENAK